MNVHSMLEVFRSYFRVEVEGLDHVPRKGRAMVISNHSGCSGLDALMLGHILQREIRRVPRIATLWTLLGCVPWLDKTAQKMGLRPASTTMLLELLSKNRMTLLFPEGVKGAFKPTTERYRLQPFHTGFIRSSLLSGSPIIPSVVIGAEEANINYGMFQVQWTLGRIALPIPLNIFPFPTKWKIRFLPPVDLSDLRREDADDRDKMKIAAERVRELMQNVINYELNQRKYIFFAAA